MTKTIKAGIGYLPTFIKDDKYEPKTGICTLIIRRFSLVRGRNDKLRTLIKTDAIDFPNEDAMVAWIEESAAFELPPEAESDPGFIPTELKLDDSPASSPLSPVPPKEEKR